MSIKLQLIMTAATKAPPERPPARVCDTIINSFQSNSSRLAPAQRAARWRQARRAQINLARSCYSLILSTDERKSGTEGANLGRFSSSRASFGQLSTIHLLSYANYLRSNERRIPIGSIRLDPHPIGRLVCDRPARASY